MKYQLRNLLVVFTIILTVFYSCAPEEDVPEIETDARDKFIGSSWYCDEVSQENGNSSYVVGIAKNNSTENGIIITNFYHLGSNESLKATVSNNIISIYQQTICEEDPYTVWGSGELINSKIYFNYYADDGAIIDTVSATYHK